MSATSKNYSMCIIFIILGAIIGGILGELLANIDLFHGAMPYLVHSYNILDIQPMLIDLYVLKISLGFSFSPNLMSMFGMVVALFLFRNY